jgi:hypothetical protein
MNAGDHNVNLKGASTIESFFEFWSIAWSVPSSLFLIFIDNKTPFMSNLYLPCFQ